MSSTPTSGPNHETAKLNYFKWTSLFLTEKPYQILMDTPDGCPSSNFEFEAAPAQTIQDLRGRESEYSLDKNGFAVRRHLLDRLRMEDWTRETVERLYFQEVDRILREEVEDVVECVIFDWRLRSSDSVDSGEALDLSDLAQYMRPIETVHIGEFHDLSCLD
ncbi:hypothetical protein EPUS_05219 [Endocarpon pusillum Z07020]|uniref:Uncharacterized protein n=1 Tax=Endocarpon pusillum (strain Z07020 / HMAS-L-300199) TaxID=1263415 RepID=U1HJI9_ENDPU|nr:uncharacterized protein EPUS_05219 [Endocarpon pusillum Z07020]ERF70400.1 hypothetical protein EPUS_05219 [Endocarpon pusillum Z07020]